MKLTADPTRAREFAVVLLIALAIWALIGFIVAAAFTSAGWMWVTFTVIVVSSLTATWLSERV